MSMLFPDPPVLGFDDFWNLCPKKVDKDAARRAFDRVIRTRRATLVDLCVGMTNYASERHGQDPKWTKNPATWLNAGSWENAPQVQSRGSLFDVADELRQ